ncbi:carbohydrate porin [Tanticharoenia sakaeratensis]|uniref:Carbohydrate-selective porin OprB n=1 Tax=Tanticharoenia sakaeratensis NBRC 103193 TaxID=1231623 RepID=A0A0D6MKS0_9PROT|nr:carbohydrate porin [Tanticharoenia sakaeratensis]GAN54076.1 carbohydrate-selective porin OprB [Tanticharoenia sakaeratensis NBRC 103193]GBQ23772.1 carbohydrate-selective porin B [Tanticharoenia sakaeratensis NBRC 103193]
MRAPFHCPLSKFARRAWLAPALATLLSHEAHAQYRGPIAQTAPSFALDTPTSYENTPFTPRVEHMFKSWGDLIKSLNDKGVGIVVDYTSESAMALDAGNPGDTGYAHQIGVELDLDWDKLIGWRGFVTHAVIVNRAGHNMAADFGDKSLNGFEEIYGGGGNTAVHLVYVYGTQNLFHDKLQIAVGKMPVNIDFSASPLFCTFMNKSMCGNPKSLTRGAAGFGTYPGSTYGTRVRYWPTHGIYAQAGLYGVNPDLNTNKYDRTGFNFNTNLYTGVYVPVEIGVIPTFGHNQLVGHYKIGIAYDSSNYADNYYDIDNAPLALTKKAARMDNGKTQLWVEGDQMLIRNGHGPLNGLYVMTGIVRNTPESSPYLYQYYFGVVDRGFWRARPLDTFGIEVSRVTASSELVSTQWLDYARGIKLPANATYPQSHLSVLEATYSIHVLPGLTIQPDYQRIMRPNLQRNKPAIDAIGLKVHAVL